MSPLRVESETAVGSKSPVKPEVKVVPPMMAPHQQEDSSSVPITILSELDSYISSRMKEQPKTLDEVETRVEAVVRANANRHRLTLPDYFQEKSYDNEAHPGAYIFRWLFKDKRSIDRALNVLGWTLANRLFFPDAPRYLFTANGGVEVGDGILAFMPAKKALEIRALPGKRSTERVQAQVTNVEADYALMTGNPKDEKIYKPDLGKEPEETVEGKVPGVLTEGRDF